ncbi:MAG: glucose-6-phosphate isomerase family protein [Candidatus Omnitrophota bacterium]
MINLKKNSGLDVGLDLEKMGLVFGDSLGEKELAARSIDEMKEVLLDKTVDAPRELYYMYRGVGREGDDEKMRRYKLRYDITVIRPGMLGQEIIKTAGHYHPGAYPELYEVLWGEALCLLQRRDEDDPRKIKDVVLVKARAREKIVCLPNYGHILINPGDKPLVTANWVSTEFSSDYSLYRQAQGAAYFVLDNDGEMEFRKNGFFRDLPEIKIVCPCLPQQQFGLNIDRPIYDILREAEKLDFLNNPQRYSYGGCFV